MPARTRITARTRLKPIDQHAARQLWQNHWQAPSEQSRNALLETYLPVVRYNAERVHAKLPDEVDVEDLVSVGTFGLMDAIAGFDPSRNIKFETYCAPRIRGAILDELRSMDWVPRLVRSRSSQMDKARKSIQNETGCTPSDDDLARKLGVDCEEYSKIKKDSIAVGVVSLSRTLTSGSSSREVFEIDVLADQRQVNPFANVSRRDLRDLVTKGLSRAERLIVILYYYEQMTMKEIGVVLDLSESRVSQMHTSVLSRLKAQLQHRQQEMHAAAV